MQSEPWLTRDKVMIDQLKTIGIEKGKPFNPDAEHAEDPQRCRARSACLARLEVRGPLRHAVLTKAATGRCRRTRMCSKACKTISPKPDAYPVDGRGVGYSMGYFSAKHLGAGQFYLMTIMDKAGQPLDGGKPYRLNVPPNAPVTLYWSATAYDRATHALIRDMNWSSRSSNTPGLQKNADGSVDIYFGS